MTALIAHDLRLATRRVAWPLAIGLHAAATTLFVAVWGPTNGVPLWTAPLLSQLVAADRLLLAVLLTWLITPLLAPDHAADLTGWSAVTGVSVTRLMLSRAVAAILMALVMVISAAPIIVAAAQVSALDSAVLMLACLEMAAFSLLVVGATALSAVIWRDRLAVWCGSMALTIAAAVVARLVSPAVPRLAVCALVTVIGVTSAVRAARGRWLWIDEDAQ